MRSSVVAIGAAAVLFGEVSAFLPPSHQRYSLSSSTASEINTSFMKQQSIRETNNRRLDPIFMAGEKFEKIDDDDDVVIAFMDDSGENGIDCYVDSYATVDGVEYTIGIPCDYTVALCYFEGDEQLVPIELDDPLMDDIFPIAEGIIEDEFGEELALLRTPQTLTLVGVRLCFASLSLHLRLVYFGSVLTAAERLNCNQITFNCRNWKRVKKTKKKMMNLMMMTWLIQRKKLKFLFLLKRMARNTILFGCLIQSSWLGKEEMKILEYY